jgi:hypothetical protein
VSEGSIGQYSADPLTVIVSGMLDRYQWGLYTLNVIQSGNPAGVWAKTRGSAYVAILDNGLETAGGIHEDLAANYRAQFSENFGAAHNGANGNPTTSDNLDEFPYPGYDYAGHGTHVTGIVAAANGNNLGGAGVCPSCSIMAGRVTTTLFGEIQPDMQILDDALFAMARRGAQVVNMSFGDPSETSLTLPDVHDALLDADERDVVVVAASGKRHRFGVRSGRKSIGRQVLGGSDKSHNLWIQLVCSNRQSAIRRTSALCDFIYVQRQGLAANIASILRRQSSNWAWCPGLWHVHWNIDGCAAREWHRGLDALCRSAATEEPDSGHPRGHEQRYAVQQLREVSAWCS